MKLTPTAALYPALLIVALAALELTIYAQNPPQKQPLLVTWDKDNQACDLVVIDGRRYRIIKHDGVRVMANIFEEGGYYIAHVGVFNGSENRILVSPEASDITFWIDGKADKMETLKPIPAEKIAQKIRSRAGWANALRSFGASMATTTQTTGTTESGSVMVTGDGGSATGTYSGSSSSTTTSPNYEAQRRAERQNAETARSAASQADSYLSAALKANTVFPQEHVSGEIYFQRKKFEFGSFSLQIGDVIYHFVLTRPKK